MTAMPLLCLLLAGCIDIKALDSDVQSFVGRDVHDIMRYLGYPDSLRDVGAETVYVWSTNRIAHAYVPTTHTGTGDIGGDPIMMVTTTSEDVPVTHRCAIVLVAGRDNSIERYQIIGDGAGCAKYSRELRRRA